MIEKEFAPYEPSLDLKELGFDEPCFATYDEDENFELQDFFQTYETFPSHIIAAPTYSQAFRWFRGKYKIRFIIQSSMSDLGEYFKVIFPNGEQRNVSYNTYEEAELACLIKLIEIVKNQ